MLPQALNAMTRGFCLLVFVFLAAAGPTALATLRYDLRLVGGGSSRSSLNVNDVLNLELFAVVTGTDALNTNEGFKEGYVSVLSSGGGNVRGNLSGTLTTTFASSGSQNGTAQDLDGDGDKDLGSNGTNTDGNFLFARAAGMQTTSGAPLTGGREYKLADLTFTVTVISNPLDPTPITLFSRVTNFTSPIGIEATWQEDGVASSMILTPGGTFPGSFPVAGNVVTLRAIPEPASGGLALLAGAVGAARYRRRGKR